MFTNSKGVSDLIKAEIAKKASAIRQVLVNIGLSMEQILELEKRITAQPISRPNRHAVTVTTRFRISLGHTSDCRKDQRLLGGNYNPILHEINRSLACLISDSYTLVVIGSGFGQPSLLTAREGLVEATAKLREQREIIQAASDVLGVSECSL